MGKMHFQSSILCHCPEIFPMLETSKVQRSDVSSPYRSMFSLLKLNIFFLSPSLPVLGFQDLYVKNFINKEEYMALYMTFLYLFLCSWDSV